MDEQDADNLRPNQSSQDVDLSDETQDFRFLSIFGKSDIAALPKRGEKDFEPDGTNQQSNILEDSRQAMHDALCGERKHTSKAHVEGTWRPEKNMTEIHVHKGPHFKTVGKADNKGTLWLLPEETIYMVERGNLECWWEEGVPMSLQGAYASCLEGCGGLERYQVYAYLKRAGYILQRAPSFFDDEIESPPPAEIIRVPTTSPPGLFGHLYNAIFGPKSPPPEGPLVPPGVYRSYDAIYERLALIQSHHPPHTQTTISSANARLPFRVAYHIWKPQPKFKKSDPPPPDFRIAVVSARETRIPTLMQLSALMDSVPVNNSVESKNVFQKLKDGYRNVILAVVDSGVTSFLKFADVGFGDELLYTRKPAGRGGRGGKGGGRGGRGGGGGGGGRGGKKQGGR